MSDGEGDGLQLNLAHFDPANGRKSRTEHRRLNWRLQRAIKVSNRMLPLQRSARLVYALRCAMI
jgi:hypothetical protein